MAKKTPAQLIIAALQSDSKWLGEYWWHATPETRDHEDIVSSFDNSALAGRGKLRSVAFSDTHIHLCIDVKSGRDFDRMFFTFIPGGWVSKIQINEGAGKPYELTTNALEAEEVQILFWDDEGGPGRGGWEVF